MAAGDGGAIPEYPAASANVLSVGGTSLHLDHNGQWMDESVWSKGGGGVSKFDAVPDFQKNYLLANQPGLTLTGRGLPDVSYDADPTTGFAVYDSFGSGGWTQVGGTSPSEPTVALNARRSFSGSKTNGRERRDRRRAKRMAGVSGGIGRCAAERKGNRMPAQANKVLRSAQGRRGPLE